MAGFGNSCASICLFSISWPVRARLYEVRGELIHRNRLTFTCGLIQGTCARAKELLTRHKRVMPWPACKANQKNGQQRLLSHGALSVQCPGQVVAHAKETSNAINSEEKQSNTETNRAVAALGVGARLWREDSKAGLQEPKGRKERANNNELDAVSQRPHSIDGQVSLCRSTGPLKGARMQGIIPEVVVPRVFAISPTKRCPRPRQHKPSRSGPTKSDRLLVVPHSSLW